MSQIFGPRANTFARASLIALAFIAIGALAAWTWFIHNAAYVTRVGIIRDQPVPFSHEIHVGDMGLDCRYCHTTVERSPFAGLPSTKICMTCHSQVWNSVGSMALVTSSFEHDSPLAWSRVHDLPDFAYFDHSAHVNNGVGCETCHGRIDQMPLVWQAEPLTMGWCLDCHRTPEVYLRPAAEVYTMGWQPPEDRQETGQELLQHYQIAAERLADCNVCHR